MGFGATKEEKEPAKARTASKSLDEMFRPAKELKVDPGLKIAIWGKQKVGKSYFCLTPPKGTIYFIDTEAAVKVTLKNFPDEVINRVKVIDILEETDLREGGSIDYDAILLIIEDAVTKIVRGVKSGELKDVTVVIDSGSDLWNWLGIWLRGRDDVKHIGSGDKVNRMEWEHANRRYEEALLKLKMAGCNVVVTYKAKDAVSSDGSDLGFSRAGWQKRSGYIFDFIGMLEKVGDKRTLKFTGVDTGSRMGDKIPDLENPNWERLVKHLEKHCGVKY